MPGLPPSDMPAELFHVLARHLPVGVIVTDQTGQILEANEAARAILGMNEEEIRRRPVDGAGWATLRQDGSPMPPEEYPVHQALRHGRVAAMRDLGLRRSDGGVRWLGVCAAPLSPPGHGAVVIFSDETEQRQVLERLTQREALYRLAVEAGGVGVWEWDLASGAIRMDPHLRQLLGYADEELPSHVDAWFALVHPEDAPRVQAKLEAHLRGETPLFEDELRLRRKDGDEVWILARGAVRLDADGRAVALAGANTDITARKLAQQAQAESDVLFRSIAEALPLGLAVVDGRRRIITANSLLRAWYPELDFDRFPLCQSLMPPDWPPCDAARCPCMEEGFTEPVERVVESPREGGARFLRFTICPLADRRREGPQVVLLVEDVTEARAVQARLHRAQKLEALGTLAGGIAHEINQPLNALQLYASGLDMLLEHQPDLDCRLVRERIGWILKECVKIRDIITHMRALSRQEGPSGVGAVDCNAAVRQSLTLVSAQLAAHGIALEMDLAEDLPLVKANAVQLEQVVINLLVNAMQALDTLPPSVRPEKRILLRTSQDPATGDVLLRVDDNGPGLGEQEDRLFDPFFTTKEAGKGMGLGLSIVHTLVSGWGAEVTAFSRQDAEACPEGGACFQVRLRPSDSRGSR